MRGGDTDDRRRGVRDGIRPVEAGLRDGDELPTFSVRQQEWGGKANLDGPFLPTARDDHSRTGWAGTTTTDM